MPELITVLPSLKTSGGNKEALRLAEKLCRPGEGQILSMWRSDHEVPSALQVEHICPWPPRAARAPLQLPLIFTRFWKKLRSTTKQQHYLFTHYATFPLSLLVPRSQRLYFVQDLEWKFLGDGLPSWILRQFILYCYRRGTIVSANRYLSQALLSLSIVVHHEWSIWADAAFEVPASLLERDVDVTMVLRKGEHKRLDLYLEFIARNRLDGRLKLAIITPDDELAALVRANVDLCLLRPTLQDMRSLYGRSKCFLHLSEHEGFGLPPLEAMAAGCVPVCRDSGGVQSFMNLDADLSKLLLPRNSSMEHVHTRVCAILESEAMASLSQQARRVFRKGLAMTAEAHSKIFQELKGRLQDEEKH